MMTNRNERKAICPVCNNNMVLVNLRGVSASSETSVNGSWYCDNCGKYSELNVCNQDAMSDREFSVYYVIQFAEAVSDTVKAEMEVSHCEQAGCDSKFFVSQDFSNTRSIKKAFAKLSGLHYRHECKVKSVIITVAVNGIEYCKEYKPNELKSAELSKLERASIREERGFIKV